MSEDLLLWFFHQINQLNFSDATFGSDGDSNFGRWCNPRPLPEDLNFGRGPTIHYIALRWKIMHFYNSLLHFQCFYFIIRNIYVSSNDRPPGRISKTRIWLMQCPAANKYLKFSGIKCWKLQILFLKPFSIVPLQYLPHWMDIYHIMTSGTNLTPYEKHKRQVQKLSFFRFLNWNAP